MASSEPATTATEPTYWQRQSDSALRAQIAMHRQVIERAESHIASARFSLVELLAEAERRWGVNPYV